MIGHRFGNLTSRIAFVTALVLALPAGATVIYKNNTNPSGIPDLTQENVPGVPAQLDSAICLAASAGDALWYFDHLTIGGVRKYSGLVAHTDATNSSKDWGKDGYQLVSQLADRIYTKNQGGWGIHQYIYSKRGDKDVSETTRTYRRGAAEVKKTVKEWNWNTDVYSDAQVTNKFIKQAIDTPTQVGIAAAVWHEQGKPPGTIMQSGRENIGHHLLIAGRDDQEKQLIVAHGWGDHWLDNANKTTPVSNSYYDAYDYTIADSLMRITDGDLIASVGGLAGRTPDYAEIENVRMLDAVGKMKFSVEAFKQAFPIEGSQLGNEAQTDTHFEFLAFNDTQTPINRLALELPLLDPVGFSAADISNVILPAGWHYRLWDPNVDTASGEMVTDQGIVNWLGFDFRGVLFESDFDLLSPGTGLDIAFDLPAALLDWASLKSLPLNAAAWTPDGNIAYVGLTMPVDEPHSIPLISLGAVLMAAFRRKWSPLVKIGTPREMHGR